MRRLKIMKDDVPMACEDDFGGAALHDRLRVYCQEQKMEMARFWIFPPNGVYMFYAVSLHLTGKDRWVEYDAMAVYLLKNLKEIGDNETLAGRLRCMFEDLGESVVLSIKADESANQQNFFKSLGMVRIPITWSDNSQTDYEVYTKGHLEMGGFAMLMERVEYVGKEIIYSD